MGVPTGCSSVSPSLRSPRVAQDHRPGPLLPCPQLLETVPGFASALHALPCCVTESRTMCCCAALGQALLTCWAGLSQESLRCVENRETQSHLSMGRTGLRRPMCTTLPMRMSSATLQTPPLTSYSELSSRGSGLSPVSDSPGRDTEGNLTQLEHLQW